MKNYYPLIFIKALYEKHVFYLQDESTKTPIQPTEKENEEKGEFRNKVKEKEENEELKEEEDWKLRLQRMRDEVKKVQELPKVIFFFQGILLNGF